MEEEKRVSAVKTNVLDSNKKIGEVYGSSVTEPAKEESNAEQIN